MSSGFVQRIDRETTLMTIEWENRIMTDKINSTVGRRFTTRGQILIFIIEHREILIANCFKLFTRGINTYLN